MTLVRLLYCSQVNGVGDSDIEDILEKSIVNNALDNITGALIYNGRFFLQCLEGNRLPVSKRYSVISRDNRHRDVELLDFSAIPDRRFPQWSMRYVGISSIDQGIIMAYTGGEFDPRKMLFPEAVVDMMWKLSQ